jgi:predicted transcriptional regulator
MCVVFGKRCIHHPPIQTAETTLVSASNPYTMSHSPPRSEGERLDQLEQMLSERSDSQLPFTEAVVTVFDIKCPEMEVYLALLDHPKSTPKELGDVLDRDRSSMGKRLRSLCEKGLVTRRVRTDHKSGTRYEYTAQPLDETVDWMTEEIEEWSADVSEQLATFRDEWPERNGQQEVESV